MRILNKKVLILFSAVLLLGVAVFSAITLLFADEENGDSVASVDVQAAPVVQGKSIIDRIIDNSNNSESTDQIYHVLEIYSGSTPSKLKEFVESGSFEKTVFDGNKSEAQTNNFNPGKIEYTGLNLKTDDATLIDAINKADLIYVSEDTSNEWSLTNDISGDVFNALNEYAVNDNGPLIIDSHNLNKQLDVQTQYTFEDLATNYFEKDGGSYASNKWVSSLTTAQFMDPGNLTVYYKAVDGDERKTSAWAKSTITEGTGDESKETVEYLAKTLTINTGTSDLALTEKFKTSFGDPYDFTNATVETIGTYTFDTNGTVLKLKDDSDVYKYGYVDRKSKPQAMLFETLDVSDSAQLASVVTLDFSQYDFIIIEAGTKDVKMDSDIAIFNSFITAMKNSAHFLYSSDICPNGGGGNTSDKLSAKNIANLYDKVATSLDIPRYDSVLVSARKMMEVYALSTTGLQVKDIADIINAGSFRGIKGNSGDSSNVYTVLEVEPCYPICDPLASALYSIRNVVDPLQESTNKDKSFLQLSSRTHAYSGSLWDEKFYYIRTDQVYDLTSDELSFGDGLSVTDLIENKNPASLADYVTESNITNVKDFYNWRLSKAKIAHATGRDYDKLQVVHMSSVEFACSRKTLLDNYDAIYFGGDYSSIKPATRWYKRDLGGKVYTMYTHDGDAFEYDNNFNDKAGNNTIGFFGGNDITASKLEELKKYAAKMPVIIDSDLSNAFVEASKPNSNQTLIDPQSNMYKFLFSLGDASSGVYTTDSDNILLNFDWQYTDRTLNENRKYGTTYGGYATVFRGLDETDYLGANVKPEDNYNGVCEVQLKRVLNNYARPLIAVTEMPTEYAEKESTWIDPATISGSGLKWVVDVSTTSTISLYIDFDGNGRFTKDEIVGKPQSGKSATLNWKPTKDFYGVVYWKVVAETSNGLSSSVTNICKIKRTTQPKMYVNLLQIMPGRNLTRNGGESNNDPRTLYLCTDCQFSGSVLTGMPFMDTGLFNSKFIGRVNTYKNAVPNARKLTEVTNVENAVNSIDSAYSYNGTKFGSHTHDFGIVKYYDDLTVDNRTGWDDVTTNWFDVLRDDYDVDMTILYTDQYENMIRDIRSKFAGKSAAEAEELISGSKGFKEKSDSYYDYYLAIKAVINGTYTKEVSGEYTVDLATLESAYPGFSKMMTDAMAAGGISGSLQDLLNKYSASSYKMDKVCEDQRSTIVSKSDKSTPEQMGVIIDSITNPKLDRDKRKYFTLFCNYNAPDDRLPDEFVEYYCDWRDAKIFENCFYSLYETYKRYSSYNVDTNKIDLKNVYSCIAIGAADYFANDDITDEEANNALLDYIDNNGTVILFHDALNVKNTQTTFMTRKLSSAFGMNARHQKVSTDTVLIDRSIQLKIGGKTVSPNISLKRNVEKKFITFEPKEVSENSNMDVKISIGGKSKSIVGLSNNDKGYNFKVTKKYVPKSSVKLDFYVTRPNGTVDKFYTYDLNASNKLIDAIAFIQGAEGYNSNQITNLNASAGTSTGDVILHINVVNGGYNNVPNEYTEQNFDTGKVYIIVDDDASNPINIVDNGDTIIPASLVSDVDYVIDDPVKIADTISGNATQEFTVTVLDESDNPVSGETVKCTVGKDTSDIDTDSSGVVKFYRYNYDFDGYIITEESEDPVTSSSGTTNNQTLFITVKDANKKPAENIQVVANDSNSTPLNSFTDNEGKVSFVYSNYIEASAENPVVTSEDISKYPKATYFMSDLSGINRKISPRMLTFKGLHQYDGIGHFGDSAYYSKYAQMYEYTSFHSQQVEPTAEHGALIAQESMEQNIKNGTPSLPTDKTRKNNEGIVTQYPFGIGDRMQVSATAPGDYAVDIEDDNLIVYYSCVGGTEGSASSLFAADPMDGLNNYFIYQYGTVYYTGAGYSLITGHGRKNNDERKLYINIIVNAGRKTGRGPSLNLYDLYTDDSTKVKDLDTIMTNKVVKPFSGGNECDYIVEIEDLSDFKGFDFLSSIPSTSKFKNVTIWYDTNHTTDINADGVADFNSSTDKLIYYSDKKITVDGDGFIIEDQSCDGNMLKSIYSGTSGIKHREDDTTVPMIALRKDCFDTDTGGQYAYIVVQVVDENDEPASATIRIQFKPELMDLN